MAAIAERIVELLREHTGRWPTRVKASMSDGLVVISVADFLSPAERQLVAAGHDELVLPARDLVLGGMRAEATAIVEQIEGREVVAYLTSNDPDQAVLVFVLAPFRL